MSIDTEDDLDALKEVGRIVRETLEAMEEGVRPGATTAEIDEIGDQSMIRRGARSAPRSVYDFPGATCISINDEIVHGIPSCRVIEPGDLVKLDVVAEKDGFMADAAITVGVPPLTDEKRRLMACVESAFHKAMAVARPGYRINQIGRAVEREVRRAGFSVIPELCGHGVGRSIHEEPIVPNYFEPFADQRLKEGMVFTVEPMIAAGIGLIKRISDGWTIRTADGSLSAHFEHTIVITHGAPILLTAPHG